MTDRKGPLVTKRDATFFVRVVGVSEVDFAIRLPNGATARIRTSDVTGLVDLPMKIGDEMPAHVADNGNLCVRFAGRRRA